MRVSNSDQETVLVIGATGRHGGTGARVVERLQAAGRLVRALVRSDDERAERLRQSGVQTLVGDLHDRRALLPALDGVDSVYVAYPVAAGIVDALANVASVIRELGTSPHVVIMASGAADPNSPSGIARAHALSEELLLQLGVNFTAVRGSAFFYENVLVLHAYAIRQIGVFANSFGVSRPAWISGTDVADLCASALLDPQSHADTPIVYPPGHELLSQQEIADIVSEETGREVRYQHITADEWSRQLQAASGGLPNHSMIEHITTNAAMCENDTTILRKDIDPPPSKRPAAAPL
ncbi:MAG TPA: NmrA family NAD(P)-binding protein [Mycobacterium sp.]|nr:NmrA family NAD(P)-binding protein [Mycobacterium sp.]